MEFELNKVQTVDVVIILIYFAIMVGIGVYFMRKSENARDFFASGGKLPWWAAGVSLYMTNFSAWTLSGAAGFVYDSGWFALIYLGVNGFAYIGGALLTAHLWRRNRGISPVEYTHTRYNVGTQQLIGWVLATTFILSAGVQLAAVSKLLASPIGVSYHAVILVVGLVILSYTFLGGLWAVAMTDFVQFVILFTASAIVVVLGLYSIGGMGPIVEQFPTLTFDHVYKGVHYNEHYLVAIFFIVMLGTAGGAAQRFYSVKDEKSARKVGILAGCLFFTSPILFGLPPMIAKVHWPDLMQVSFFADKFQPKDLVFLGLSLKILPTGLIGVFLAALLAATMSALSSVYNKISAVIARDIYKDAFNPDATDQQVFKAGRIATAGMGITVILLAMIFVYSEFGIFNIMMAFFTLFNIPLNVALAFGLIFRKVPRWGAVASISWGLLIGIITRWLLGWTIGPQNYLMAVVSFSGLVLSPYLGRLYKEDKRKLIGVSVAWTVVLGALFYTNIAKELTTFIQILLPVATIAIGASTYYFSSLFARETREDREIVENFFKRLDTPVDVAKEVFIEGEGIRSQFPFLGGITIFLGGLILLVFLGPIEGTKSVIFLYFAGILLVLGFAMVYGGKRAEKKAYEEFRQELEDRGMYKELEQLKDLKDLE